MFRFDVGVAYLLHVIEFRGLTYRQSGESRSAIFRRFSGGSSPSLYVQKYQFKNK